MRTSGGSLAIAAALVAACGGKNDAKPADSAAAAANAAVSTAVAGKYTLDDFRRLRWIDGRWRGFMPDGNTFYEQYRFVNDSTIAMHAFPDPTFDKASDSSRIELRGGTVSNDGGSALWVATRLDSTGIDFAPHHGATNHFTWALESPTKWSAALRWTDKDGRAQSVAYALHKFGQ